MAKRAQAVPIRDGIRIQGFVRLAILDYDKDGVPRIIARDERGRLKDSGKVGPNVVTNIGFLNYVNYILGSSTGSTRVSYAAVGTGTNPATNAGSLPGETMARKPTTYSAPNSTMVRFIASWASNDNTSGGNIAVANAGLYAHSSELSLMCGKTYTSSTWGTNQALNLTYEINLS